MVSWRKKLECKLQESESIQKELKLNEYFEILKK